MFHPITHSPIFLQIAEGMLLDQIERFFNFKTNISQFAYKTHNKSTVDAVVSNVHIGLSSLDAATDLHYHTSWVNNLKTQCKDGLCLGL